MSGVYAAVVRFDLFVPESRSLKRKRQAVRPIIEGLRNKFKVSVAEVGFHEQWQRAAIGVAVVAESSHHLEEVLATCERFVYAAGDVEVLDMRTSYLEDDA